MRQVDDTELGNYGITAPRLATSPPTRDNMITNAMVQTGQYPANRAEIYENPNPYQQYGSEAWSPENDPTNPSYWTRMEQSAEQPSEMQSPYDFMTTSATPQTTIQKPKSFEGFLENARNDVGNIVTGIASLPKVGQAWAKDPVNMTGKLAGAVVGGVVDDYVKLFTNPVETLYNRPLTGTLDALSIIMPAVKGVKAFKAAKAQKLAKVAEMAGAGASPLDNIVAQSDELLKAAKTLGLSADQADDVARIATRASLSLDDLDDITDIGRRAGLSADKIDELVDVAKRSGNSVEDVEKLAKSLTAGKKAGMTADTSTWLRQFTVPTKRAAQLDTPMVAKYIWGRYGITAPSIDEYKRIAGTFTGNKGMFTDMVRGSLQQLDEPIDVSNVAKTIAREAKRSALVPEGEKLQHLDAIYDAFKTYAGVVPDADPLKVAAMSADNAFALAKQWEDFGHSLINKSTYLTQYPHWSQVGKIYVRAADQLVNSIDDALRQTDILQAYKTPEVVAEITKLSPQLAKDFARARTFRDFRRLQMPFVRLSQMADLTTYAQQSAAIQLGRQLGMSVAGGVVGGALGGIPAAVGGTALSTVLAPVAEKATFSMTPRVASAFAQYLKGTGGKLGAIMEGLKAVPPAMRSSYLKQYLPLIIAEKLMSAPQTTLEPEQSVPNATPIRAPQGTPEQTPELPAGLEGVPTEITGVNPYLYNQGGYYGQ